MRTIAKLPTFLILAICASASIVLAEGPSFDCKTKGLGAVETLICSDTTLSALDREIAATYQQAHAKAGKGTIKTLEAEQRGWVKGRNECWKSDDKGACITDEYLRRLGELQARYALIEPNRNAVYQCDNNPAHELVARYYPTKKASVVVEHGDDSFLLFVDTAAGDHYTGRNEQLSVDGTKVKFVPAYQAPEIICSEVTK